MNETRIEKMIKTLGISREEAIELIRDDEEVDRMTSTKEIDSDLTEEQKKATKKARQSERTKTVYNFDTSKRKRAENPQKREIIEILRTAVEENGATEVNVTNVEREFEFVKDGIKYRVTMAVPRK